VRPESSTLKTAVDENRRRHLGQPGAILSSDLWDRTLDGERLRLEENQACLILLSVAPNDPGMPYERSATQEGFATFGGPHILTLVTEVATRALKAVWFQKWLVHRRLRPEAMGGLVHQTLTGTAHRPLHSDILRSGDLIMLPNLTAAICFRRRSPRVALCTRRTELVMPRSRAPASPFSRHGSTNRSCSRIRSSRTRRDSSCSRTRVRISRSGTS
jgi:hypothetical protein